MSMLLILIRYDRVNHVLANTVQQEEWDGRFSHNNKDWAKTFVIPDDKDGFGSDRRRDCVVESHPAVLDGFINQARHEYLLTQPLTNMEIEKEANRLLTRLRSEYEPNSPSGTHFMAQISDDFMFRASSKDTDKLSAMLPFKSLALQLLTISQLLEQRDTTVTYEAAQSKHTKPQERAEKKGKILSSQRKKVLLSKVAADRTVTHSKFGKGVITKNDGAYVTIRFDEVAGEKKFDLTMAVQNGLIEI